VWRQRAAHGPHGRPHAGRGRNEGPGSNEGPEATKAPEATAVPAEGNHISVAGSTTVQPLAEKLAEQFVAANPGVKIDVAGGGSSAGVKAAGDGTADIGAASRAVKAEEKTTYPDIVIFAIAWDGIAVVVHPEVPVDELTKEQVREIFAGNITNWSEVGGADAPIP
jgi:phosphate transport system substrate-binding protein